MYKVSNKTFLKYNNWKEEKGEGIMDEQMDA